MPTGIDAGTAYISIKPNAAGFSTALKAQVTPQINAVGASASKGLQAIVKSSGLGATAIGLAWAGAAVAVGKFVGDSIRSYQEHEAAVTALNNVIKDSPKLVGETTAAFEEQATALQNLTGVQDEQILAADTVLARFDLTGQQIRELTPLVLDFAQATGQDATAASESIGKALLGNTRALKAVGIEYKVTGDRAKDLAAIQDLLKEKVGGAAEAFGQTSAGKFEIFKAKLDDLQEAIGGALVPALDALVGALGAILPVLTPLAGVLPEIVGAFLAFKAITFLPGLLLKVATSLETIGALKASETFLNMAAGLEGFAASAGPVAVALGLITIGTIKSIQAANEQNAVYQKNLALLRERGPATASGAAAQKALNDQIDAGVNRVDLYTQRSVHMRQEVDAAAGATRDAATGNASLASAAQAVNSAFQAAADRAQTLTDRYYANATAALAARDAQLALQGGLFGVLNSLEGVRKAHQESAAAQAEVNKLQDKGKEGTKEYAAAVADLRDKRLAEANAVFGQKNAVQSYADTLMGPLKTAQDNAGKAQLALNKLRADPKADPAKLAAAEDALAAANDNVAAAQRGLLPAQQRAIKGFNDTLRAAGLTQKQIHALDQQLLGYIDNTKGVPSKKSTQFSTPGLDKAKGDVASYKAALANIPRSITTVVHAVASIGAGIGQLLGGGKGGAEGGVFKAARGVRFAGPGRSGMFIAGEASYPTPLGTGAEIVTGRGIEPLAADHLERIADFLAARMERGFRSALWAHSQSTGPGGPREVVLRARGRDLVGVLSAEELWAR